MKKAVVIVGPTASGKTALGISLAQKYNGAIVSADSVQVHKGLDIVSGKDLSSDSPYTNYHIPLENKNFNFGYYVVDKVKIYLLDLVSSEYSFSVSDYISVAKPTIEMLSINNILPVVVGGTGFYIKTLLDGVETLEIPPNDELRTLLENKTIDDLTRLLMVSNPKKYESMNESDRKNKRRLIRAIEIAKFEEQVKKYSSSEVGKFKSGSSLPLKRDRTINELEGYDILMIGLFADREVIKQRIDRRVDQRVADGAFMEAENLFKNYKNLSSSVKNANGYRQLFEYFLGKVNKEEAIDNWRKAEYLNAKKQLTWFRKDKRIRWFDIEDPLFFHNISDEVGKWQEAS